MRRRSSTYWDDIDLLLARRDLRTWHVPATDTATDEHRAELLDLIAAVRDLDRPLTDPEQALLGAAQQIGL